MLTKNDLKQIKDLLKDELDVTKTDILAETRVIIKYEIHLALKPIEERLDRVEEKVDKLFEMEDEDIKSVIVDIEFLKKEIKQLKDKLKKAKI